MRGFLPEMEETAGIATTEEVAEFILLPAPLLKIERRLAPMARCSLRAVIVAAAPASKVIAPHMGIRQRPSAIRMIADLTVKSYGEPQSQ